MYEGHDDHDSAFNDFTNSLNLTLSISEEIAARLGRMRAHDRVSESKYSWEDFEKDYYWLRENTEGYERGETIFTYWFYSEYQNLDIGDYPEKQQAGESMVSEIDEVIRLGFENPEIYFLRSFGNKVASNYGLALHDIDKAISMTCNNQQKVEFLCHRAEILVCMKGFYEAYKTIKDGEKINKVSVENNLSFILYGWEEEFLCLFGLEKRFNKRSGTWNEPIFSMLKLLLLWK